MVLCCGVGVGTGRMLGRIRFGSCGACVRGVSGACAGSSGALMDVETDADRRGVGEGGGRLTEEEFGVLYARHYAALCVVARGMGAGSGAEDVVQDAALVAAERLEQFERGTDFRAWMAAIVRGVARNAARGARRRALHTAAARRERPVSVEAGEGVAGVFDERVRNALGELGHLEGSCILLRVGFDYGYREIAESLGIAEATARSHVYRARRRLLEKLGGGSVEENRS